MPGKKHSGHLIGGFIAGFAIGRLFDPAAQRWIELRMPNPISSSQATTDSKPDVLTAKDRLDYYWKHFALIADQRVKTFNFYILVVGFTLLGTAQALNPESSIPRQSRQLIGAGHVFCVILFWMIERRGKALVDIAKEGLRGFEDSPEFGSGYKPMSQEDRPGSRGLTGLVSYGKAFRLAFIVHFIFGMVILFYPEFIVRPTSQPKDTKEYTFKFVIPNFKK